MFFSLLGKECKMWLKSILFFVYVIVLIMFYITQMDGSVITKPYPDQEDYGLTYTTDETVIMEHTLRNLIMEYTQGSFTTYPIGFYKEVILDEEEMSRISDIISNITGLQKEKWMSQETVQVKKGFRFSEFKEEMDKVSRIIGAGSSYSKERLQRTEVAMTYEQALKEYNDICQLDHVTGTYARLFCDYVGIILGILPAFFGVARVLRDRRSRAAQVLYTKSVPTVKVIAARYLSMVIVMVIPVLLLSSFAMSQAVYVAKAVGVVPDYLAFVKYSLLWLLPIILFVTAVSYVIGELTENVLSVLVCCAIWFAAIFMGSSNDLIYAGWNMIPRFNSLGDAQLFQSILPQLIRNRFLYSGIAIILVVVAAILYEKKRRGGICYGRKIRENRVDKFKA